jgi:hypothetical protein
MHEATYHAIRSHFVVEMFGLCSYHQPRKTDMADNLILQRLAYGPHELPCYLPDLDGPRVPRWLKRAARALITGYVPVVLHSEMERDGDRYSYAGELDSVVYAWRDDSAQVWTLVSVFLDEPDCPDLY